MHRSKKTPERAEKPRPRPRFSARPWVAAAVVSAIIASGSLVGIGSAVARADDAPQPVSTTTTEPASPSTDPTTTAPADPTTSPADPTTSPADPTTAPVDPTTAPADPTSDPTTGTPTDTASPTDTAAPTGDPTTAPPTSDPTTAPPTTAPPTGDPTAPPTPPTPTITPGSPTITGTATVTHKLTVLTTSWAPAGVVLSYQWLDNGTAITGANSANYTPTLSEGGHTLTATVTGTLTGYPLATATTPGTKLSALGFTTASHPVITGTARFGNTLTAQRGTWAPSGVAFYYQWYRNGVALSGATRTTYALSTSDIGTKIRVGVKGEKAGYTPTEMLSGVLTISAGQLTAPANAKITGAPNPSNTLTAQRGTWSPSSIAFYYQWYRNGTAISGATRPTYSVLGSDLGKSINVQIKGAKAGYTSVTIVSGKMGISLAKLTAPANASISGTPHPGNTLTAQRGTWSPSSIAFYYQWYRNGAAISGATGPTYGVPNSDIGKSITVSIKGAKAGYASTVIVSGKMGISAAPVVAPPAPPAASYPIVVFKNCAAMNKVYPHGVAKDGTTYDLNAGRHLSVAAGTVYDTALYNANPGRDGDGDGIDCEVR